jgi:hypothetical protein
VSLPSGPSLDSFDDLDLELGPGTMFIVTSNGIGMTSLMMAAVWGLFGDASGVDPSEETRGDAEGTSVELLLALPATGPVAFGAGPTTAVGHSWKPGLTMRSLPLRKSSKPSSEESCGPTSTFLVA